MIANDNKETKYHPYYRFEGLFDNKAFVMIANDNKELCSGHYQ
jgi:hypothetical protein